MKEKIIPVSKVIELLVEERTRARDIAYEFHKEYDDASIQFPTKLNRERADLARRIGNAVSGANALSSALGETIEERIVRDYKDELEIEELVIATECIHHDIAQGRHKCTHPDTKISRCRIPCKYIDIP